MRIYFIEMFILLEHENVTIFVQLGDRLQFIDYLTLLKKHKRDADRSKALWTGTTPVLNLRYHRNVGEFCFHVSIRT